MKKSHVAGWVSDSPTPAQLKEFFDQIEHEQIKGKRLQAFLRGEAVFGSIISEWVDPNTIQLQLLKIKYGQRIEEMVKGLKGPSIISDHFPGYKMGQVFSKDVQIFLHRPVPQDQVFSTEGVISAIHEAGFWPYGIPELTALKGYTDGLKGKNRWRISTLREGEFWESKDGLGVLSLSLLFPAPEFEILPFEHDWSYGDWFPVRHQTA